MGKINFIVVLPFFQLPLFALSFRLFQKLLHAKEEDLLGTANRIFTVMQHLVGQYHRVKL